MEKHLWEVKHPYYCADGNYYSNDCVFEHRSWADFLLEMGDADLDYNLFFRFDWSEEDDDGNCTFNGDENYRNGVLKMYIMQQRKGRFTICHVDVCRADEQAVKEYLQPRLNYLKKLWEPML